MKPSRTLRNLRRERVLRHEAHEARLRFVRFRDRRRAQIPDEAADFGTSNEGEKSAAHR